MLQEKTEKVLCKFAFREAVYLKTAASSSNLHVHFPIFGINLAGSHSTGKAPPPSLGCGFQQAHITGQGRTLGPHGIFIPERDCRRLYVFNHFCTRRNPRSQPDKRIKPN